jgi:hypothetical protein
MRNTIIRKTTIFSRVWLVTAICILCGCSQETGPDVSNTGGDTQTRLSSLPDSAVKITPDTDLWPPVIHASEWSSPIPMPGPVNTAGVEDAPVITPDGNTFVFFFTPDGNLSAGQQIQDGVTGVWWCTWNGTEWSEPVRALLAGAGEMHLDGSFAVQGDTLWFGSIRQGNYGDIDIYTAELSAGRWKIWQNAGEQINSDFDAGELYLTGDGMTLYYGSTEGGLGQNDLWSTTRNGSVWTTPVNLGVPVNSSEDESRPYVSSDGTELWFTKSVSGLGYPGPAIFRSVNTGGVWSTPVEIVSQYVGDPGLDDAGNLYFTHVFYDDDDHKIETDIYVAYRQ